VKTGCSLRRNAKRGGYTQKNRSESQKKSEFVKKAILLSFGDWLSRRKGAQEQSAATNLRSPDKKEKKGTLVRKFVLVT